MRLELNHNEQLIGRSHLILKSGSYIKKYYPLDQTEMFDTWWLNHVKQTTKLFKIVHPDLYVSETTDNNFYCVTQNYIEHNESKDYSYQLNISNYLSIINDLGFDYAKRDMQWYNLIYRKEDEKPFCIDWDAHEVLYSEEHAYEYYKSELINDTWKSLFNISDEDAESTFNTLWRMI